MCVCLVVYVCVCECVWVGGWVGGWVDGCGFELFHVFSLAALCSIAASPMGC